MAQIFPIDFDEKLTIAQDDFILFSDSEDGNKIKKAQYSNLKWEKWDTGTAATITVWSTTTWTPWSSASVVNSWTTSAAVLDFTIPEWEKGDTWDTGASVTSAAFNWNDIDFWLSDWTTVTLEDAKIDLKWDAWDAATISVGTTSTLSPGSSATVTNSWTSSAAVFNFWIPKGDKWDTWDKGDQWDKWDKGDTWTAATISVGTTTTWEPWTDASVTNSWTSSAAVFNFTIPKGDKGDTWDTWATWPTWAKINSASFSGDDMVFGLTDSSTVTLTWAKTTLTWPQGETGPAATISVWTTTTWEPGTNASVTNSWTSGAAVFNFTIPKGAKGAKGDTGAAATITVWSTTTWDAWTSATVTNSGTSSAAVLDFTIPKWDKWDTWNTWATGNGIASITSEKSWKVTTVTITETNWDDYSFHVLDWADGEWSWDVIWPNSSTDWNVVLFDWATGKLIKDSWKTIPTTASDVNALPSSTKYWASISVSIDTTDYKITTTLKDQDWNTLGTAQVIDLPLESVVVSGSYDSVNKKVVLTLENGNTVEFSVADLVAWLQSEITSSNKLDADLVDDSTSTNKFVTAANKTTWNWKQDALVSWTNIKTVNGTSILWSWDIVTPNTTYSTATSTTSGLVKLWSDTVQSVSANAVSWTASRTYATQLNSSDQLVVNVPRTDTTYESKTAASWGTDVSLVTTWEKYTWNNKQNALTTQTAYTTKWTSTKVATISTNTLGQVTAITETSIDFPVTSVNGSTWAVTVSEFNPWGTATTWYVLKKTADWYWWDAESWAVTSVNGQTWAVTVSEFTPTSSGSTDQVLTKTANWYDWATPAASGIVCDPSSPITIDKIRCWTEAQYQALATKDSSTAYLTV